MSDLDRSLAVQRRGLETFMRLLARSSEGARLYEAPGVLASTIPVAATHSVANSVVYEDAGRLAAELDNLAEHYDAAGIDAWTVWVPERDREAARLLGSAGHLLDAAPAAMEMELADLEPAPAGSEALEWDNDVSGAEVGRLNDHAYGFDHPAFELILADLPPTGDFRFYRTSRAGEAACVLATIDVGDDCLIFFVATHRDHRGRGLARELLREALFEARDRGLRTSSLQATKLGEPVYQRLGYRAVCAMEMWERRKR
jgi:GNAT superfamily N-acetyltransferase